jgi:two-component system sensor histidine kinase EvgS
MSTSDDTRSDDLQQEVLALRKRVQELEAVLADKSEKLSALTDSAPVGIFLDDSDGRAIYINKKCAEFLGVPAEQALDFDWIPLLHPDDRDRVVSAWQAAFQSSSVFLEEYRYVHADGKVVWVLGEVHPVLGDDGKAALFVGSLTDITSQKEAEVEHANLQAQLVQAQKMETVGLLAGGVAHDYNNMLSVILVNTELAMSVIDNRDSVYPHLKQIFQATTRSAEVTRQLLSFARKQIVSPDVFDMNQSVEDMLSMLERLIGEDIQVEWNPQAGALPVKMDPTELDRILVNLCINARDAIEDGGTIFIQTASAELDMSSAAEYQGGCPGEYAVLSIRDTGIGMDDATLDKIFEPFFTTKGDHAGTGLGLASVYGMIKRCGGFIHVESEPGQGSAFSIFLPAYKGPLPEKEETEESRVLHGGGKTVLVVEDEAAILEAIQCILCGSDYKVLAAQSPEEAVDLSRNYDGDIDLLITDVIMPRINGRDLSNRLRENRPDMKCLYMSGYTADIIATQGVLQENVMFIQKPFGKKVLLEKVYETLNLD